MDLLQRTTDARVFAPRSSEYDLRLQRDVAACLAWSQPDVVLHLAAYCGGIKVNATHPGRLFYDNAIMGVELIEACRQAQVAKFVCVGTVCAYPRNSPLPMHEDDFWDGYPEEITAAYGMAKKMLLVQLDSYRKEYGFNGVYLIPVNLYGPGDHFDLETSHVMPALVRKFVDAAEDSSPAVSVWGDGTATREFLYAADAAQAIVMAAEMVQDHAPINIGSAEEITIADLSRLVAELAGYSGAIVFDASKPAGTARRRLDLSRAKAKIGWEPSTTLREGIAATVDYYRRARLRVTAAS